MSERDRVLRLCAETVRAAAGLEEDQPVTLDLSPETARAFALSAKAAVDALVRERDRLSECMSRAGLAAFIRDGKPEDIAEHLRSVVASYDVAAVKAERERDEARAEVESLKAERERLMGEVENLEASLDNLGYR